MDVAAVVATIDADLHAHAVPGRAEKEKAYLKSRLDHLGTSVPAIRTAVRSVVRAHRDLDHDALVAIASQLWSAPVHERRAAAVELLEQCSDRLGPADLPLLERLLRESQTWALVDGLAASVVGAVIARHRESATVLDRWAADPDFWLRRSALLALLIPLRRGDGDFPRFGRYADLMLEEREFFIRKAIGWVLRDTARKRPDLVYDWLMPRAARASGLTVREASKGLSEHQRAQLLAAAAGGRPRA